MTSISKTMALLLLLGLATFAESVHKGGMHKGMHVMPKVRPKRVRMYRCCRTKLAISSPASPSLSTHQLPLNNDMLPS